MDPVIAISRRLQPIEAVVRPPGSKSITNRALIVAALARGGVSRLYGALEADDTQAMRKGLGAFGVSYDDHDDPWLVLGSGGELVVPVGSIDARESGTTARFLAPLAALVNGSVRITGRGRLPERPFQELADALTRAGVGTKSSGGGLPLEINGTGRFPGGRIEVDPSRSSQFASALLLIAPLADQPTELVFTSAPSSAPYLATTAEVMQVFGSEVTATSNGYRVANNGYRNTHFEIEADASAAAYPLVAGAITGGVVVIDGIPHDSQQADLLVVDVLKEMGCAVEREETRLRLTGGKSLHPVDIDMSHAPDGSLAVAVSCLFAIGPSRIRGLHTLRLKESDRLAALVAEINRIGGDARVEGDDLIISPRPLSGGRVESHGDHRMAMAMALVGLRVPGIEITSPGVVEKTWPGFFQMLERL